MRPPVSPGRHSYGDGTGRAARLPVRASISRWPVPLVNESLLALAALGRLGHEIAVGKDGDAKMRLAYVEYLFGLAASFGDVALSGFVSIYFEKARGAFSPARCVQLLGCDPQIQGAPPQSVYPR
eukprot:scaffold293712_cov32-Tisochrysis_lutea.AAC.3